MAIKMYIYLHSTNFYFSCVFEKHNIKNIFYVFIFRKSYASLMHTYQKNTHRDILSIYCIAYFKKLAFLFLIHLKRDFLL